MTDYAAALAAIMARLNRHIGQRVTFTMPNGVKITGTLSEYELSEAGGGTVWVRFRECEDRYEVSGFPEKPQELAGQPRQIEQTSEDA